MSKLDAAKVLKQLSARGTESVRQIYLRQGAPDAFGALMGQVRALAKTLGTNHALGLALWKAKQHEARVLACMLLDPGALTEKEARALLASAAYPVLVDELVGRVLVHAPFADALGEKWRKEKDELARRAGWKLLGARVTELAGLDAGAVLARIERELPAAPFRAKEGMNFCLVQLGTQFPAHTEQAVALGERLGVWDLRPIPRGCTSAYAPEWIAVLLARKSAAWKARAAKAVAVREQALAAARAAEKAERRAVKEKPAARRAAAR